MKIVIDMNLSPTWVSVLTQAGHSATHWSQVGAPNAPDREVLIWARQHGYVVFAHDLDFGAILAATDANAPSVIRIRTQDVTPDHSVDILLAVLQRYGKELSEGALISVHEDQSRIRLLPLEKQQPGMDRKG